MRYRAILIICAAVLLRVAAVANEYNVKLSIMSPDNEKISVGSGGFTAADREYGRIVVRFYGDDPANFGVSAIGTRQFPPSWPEDDSRSKGLSMIADFYVVPSAVPGNRIRLRGQVLTWQRGNGADSLMYRPEVHSFEDTLTNGGEMPYLLNVSSGAQVSSFKLSVSSPSEIVYSPKTVHHVDFSGQYQLNNTTSGQIELAGRMQSGLRGRRRWRSGIVLLSQGLRSEDRRFTAVYFCFHPVRCHIR